MKTIKVPVVEYPAVYPYFPYYAYPYAYNWAWPYGYYGYYY